MLERWVWKYVVRLIICGIVYWKDILIFDYGLCVLIFISLGNNDK